VLRRAYGFAREQICRKVEELLATEALEIEAAHDTARAALRYRRGDADFADFHDSRRGPEDRHVHGLDL